MEQEQALVMIMAMWLDGYRPQVNHRVASLLDIPTTTTKRDDGTIRLTVEAPGSGIVLIPCVRVSITDTISVLKKKIKKRLPKRSYWFNRWSCDIIQQTLIWQFDGPPFFDLYRNHNFEVISLLDSLTVEQEKLHDGQTITVVIPDGYKRVAEYRKKYTSMCIQSYHRKNLVQSLDVGLDQSRITNTYFPMESIFPRIISDFSHLQNLVLRDKCVCGRIPTQIGLLTQLRDLMLNENNLTGTIPTHIGCLTNLISLTISYNHLTGPIPTHIGLLTKLKFFAMSSNAITGSIPTHFGLLTKLEVISIDDNKLTGPIPTHIGLLKKLRCLALQRNTLTGSIPSNLVLPKLKFCGLFGNNLTTETPISFNHNNSIKRARKKSVI